MDSKHSEIGVDADIVGDIGDGSRTPGSAIFAFFKVDYPNPLQCSVQ